MPRDIVVCYFCNAVIPLFPNHSCQPECDPPVHYDFCRQCIRHHLSQWLLEYHREKKRKDDP